MVRHFLSPTVTSSTIEEEEESEEEEEEEGEEAEEEEEKKKQDRIRQTLSRKYIEKLPRSNWEKSFTLPKLPNASMQEAT